MIRQRTITSACGSCGRRFSYKRTTGRYREFCSDDCRAISACEQEMARPPRKRDPGDMRLSRQRRRAAAATTGGDQRPEAS